MNGKFETVQRLDKAIIALNEAIDSFRKAGLMNSILILQQERSKLKEIRLSVLTQGVAI